MGTDDDALKSIQGIGGNGEAPLDVFITRKIGAPGNLEYAIGAVAETGSRYLNQEAVNSFGLFRYELDRLGHAQEKEFYKQGLRMHIQKQEV